MSRIFAVKAHVGRYGETVQLMTGRQLDVRKGGRRAEAESRTDAHLVRGRRYVTPGKLKETEPASGSLRKYLKIYPPKEEEALSVTLRGSTGQGGLGDLDTRQPGDGSRSRRW